MFHSYGEKSALGCIALKAAMLCCTLLLQKPHPNASSRDFINCLQCWLPLWQGSIEGLLLEGCTVQHRLSTIVSTADHNEHLTSSFVSHMLRGNVQAALAVLDVMDRPGAPL